MAVVDPVSRGAQKIAPLLLALKDVLNAKVSVFLNCVEKHSEMPQKSYFRTVLDTELRFDAGGKLTQVRDEGRKELREIMYFLPAQAVCLCSLFFLSRVTALI